MDLLAAMFVARPLSILMVAAVFLAIYLLLRFTPLGRVRHPRALLVASTLWGLYAGWEWLVRVESPEANIRVDLLVLWPVLVVVSAWALFRGLRRVR